MIKYSDQLTAMDSFFNDFVKTKKLLPFENCAKCGKQSAWKGDACDEVGLDPDVTG